MFAVTSPGFVLFVAALALLWYNLPPSKRWLAMLGAGILFYLTLDLPGFFVLLACSAAVWYCALHANRRGWLLLGLAAAVGPLLLLKYSGMVVPSLRELWRPVSIAYFSLQLTGYLVDVARGRLEAETRFSRLFCYASFFLSITQGPFTRYDRLMPQLERDVRFDAHRLWRGAARAAWGYFKKFAIAERAAVVVSFAFDDPTYLDRSQLIFGTVMFSLQLYADFSGYTDIVLGAGECLGLELPENFRQPFLAATVHELWARWHISLSQWFRDYVYIPLGGNRKGIARRDANLLATFLVSGLWHGANWTFLVWGGLHGLAQAAENHLPWRKRITKGPLRLVGIAGTFAIFVVTFTIFRADSLEAAVYYFSCILHNSGGKVFSEYWRLGLSSRLQLLQLLAGVAILAAVDILHEGGIHLRDWLAARPAPVRWAAYECALLLFLFMGQFLGGGNFLYARF